MSTAAREPIRWSRRRWICTVAALFIAQAALVLYLGQRDPIPPPRPPFRTTVYLGADEWSSHQLAHQPDLSDPSLLALPNLRGFSGPAWLKFTRPEAPSSRWSEPPHWLPLEAGALGKTFAEFISTNRLPPPLLTDKPLPRLIRYEPNFPGDPPAQKSRWRIQGDLAHRSLAAPLEIKSWPSSDILSNTTVQVAVDAEGFMVFTTLLTESGLREADRYPNPPSSPHRQKWTRQFAICSRSLPTVCGRSWPKRP